MQELGVVAKWGKPVWEFWRREVPLETEARADRVGEAIIEMNSTPRDPTARECYAAFGNFVYTWRKEHPDYEVIYLEVSRSSPQRLRMQFRPLPGSSHTPFLLIIGWIITIAVAAFLFAVVIAPAVKFIYEIWTGTGAAGEAFKYLMLFGIGLMGIWGFSKVYPAIKGKAKKG